MRRLVTYVQDGRLTPGAEIDGQVLALEAVGWDFGGSTPSIRNLLRAGPGATERALGLAAAAMGNGNADAVRPAAQLTFAAPVPDAGKILCVGANYMAHLREAEPDAEPTEFPEVFGKFANTLIGHGQAIPLSSVSHEIDYEGELAFVIGERCKSVSESEALSKVAGYAPFNDVTARDVQLRVSQWAVGKSFDGFGPFGPGLVPASDIADPQSLDITTRLNGEVMQRGNTSDMIFGIRKIIAYLSSMITLEPGDVIATGTPAGVGMSRDPVVWLKDGDVIEVELEGAGVVSNPVRAET